ncbi:B3 domain-containing protein Os07g0563300-like isoform X2 [Carica papaya]|uniref:B3 domain-containing protein Os07g0563300-like isoform X2 n=1 Tax=Carica papaya TaxID=3649 RepID=UPI000B8C8916|nr:B3 domain-containing protein Os07g0563300-like isoform X2 [Carica papaya]
MLFSLPSLFPGGLLLVLLAFCCFICFVFLFCCFAFFLCFLCLWLFCVFVVSGFIAPFCVASLYWLFYVAWFSGVSCRSVWLPWVFVLLLLPLYLKKKVRDTCNFIFVSADSYSILNETNIGMMGPGAPAHAVGPTPEIGEQFHGASLYGADLFHEDDMYSQIEEETSGWNLLYPHNLPEITSGRLPEININSKPALIPLFEKVLVPSDADPCRGMLFLPKLYSEIYFPELPLGQKMPLLVQDITGVNWQFVYGVWWMNGRKIYVLEGFDGYMTLMGLKPGDKVTFYRTEPEKKLIIRLQKAPDNK